MDWNLERISEVQYGQLKNRNVERGMVRDLLNERFDCWQWCNTFVLFIHISLFMYQYILKAD